MAMRVLSALDELAELVGQRADLFVRWSAGPEADVGRVSRDDLTGASLPGLSANPLTVEDWWGDRSLSLWVARRLHDYSHLKHDKGPGVRPWIMEGEELGRGPDNEPLVRCRQAIAWIDDEVMAEAERIVADRNDMWGPLRRPGD
jgi:hypothetical protein